MASPTRCLMFRALPKAGARPSCPAPIATALKSPASIGASSGPAGNRRLFVIDPDPAYEPLDALIAGAVNMEVIEQHWDEVLRLKASIGAGLVPPSVILKKLSASPRQNRLNQALREMGRIERSIFIYVTWNPSRSTVARRRR